MRLNRDGIIELRKRIKEQIEKDKTFTIPCVDDKLIDALMFDTKTDEFGHDVKYAVWTGKFLQYIDLSRVDFSNVCFDAGDIAYEDCGHCINLSNTNANIDFALSYGKVIKNCNFSDCKNLENLDNIDKIYNSDFSCSNACITPILAKIQKDNNYNNYVLQNCNFSDCNGLFNGSNLVDIDKINYNNIVGTNFTYTDIDFICDLSKKSNLEIIRELIKKDLIGGCYLNRKYIYTKTQLDDIKENKIKEYEKYKDNLVKSFIR